jgi:hypothetical protein
MTPRSARYDPAELPMAIENIAGRDDLLLPQHVMPHVDEISEGSLAETDEDPDWETQSNGA